MPETQPTQDQYIEPPPVGWGGIGNPTSTPTDTFGVQPAPRAPAPPKPQTPTGPPDEVIPPPGGQQQPLMNIAATGGGSSDLRDQIKQMWINAGATPEAADGIANRIQVESGFNPLAMGDYRGNQPTSFGLYQHHNERAGKLFAFAKQAGKSPSDPLVQTEFAIHEAVNGGDAIASANWEKIKSDPTGTAFTRFFERPAGSMSMVASAVSPDLQAAHEQLVASGQRERDAITAGKADLERLIAAEPPGSAKRDKLMDEMRSSIAAKEAAWKEKYDHPPVLRPVDAFQNFGSVGTIVALIGGLFARRHMTAALGAAGRAMQAINQNNFDQYQQQMKVWETQTRSAAEELHMQHQDLEMMIRDKQMSWDQKQALISNKFKEIGLDREVAAIQHGDAQTWMNTIALMDRTQNTLKNQAAQMTIVNRSMAEQNWNQQYYDQHPDMTGKPIPLDEQVKRTQYLDQNFPLPGAPHATGVTQTKAREQETAAEVARRDAEYAKAHPEATQSEKEKAHFENRTAVEKELARATHTPRNAQAMYFQTFMEENPKATSEEQAEAMAFYRRLQATESSFAGGVNGRNLMSLNTVAGHIIDVFRYAEELRNGQIPRANAVANRIAVELGKPEVTSFEAGRDIMTGEVVRLLTSTGGSVEDRTRMIGLIGKAFSPEQFAGVERVFKEMIGDRLAGMEQGYARNDPKRRAEFETNMLTDKAKQVFSETVGRGVSAPSSAAPAAPPTVRSQSDYDALPPGSRYIGPDGKVREKP